MDNEQIIKKWNEFKEEIEELLDSGRRNKGIKTRFECSGNDSEYLEIREASSKREIYIVAENEDEANELITVYLSKDKLSKFIDSLEHFRNNLEE